MFTASIAGLPVTRAYVCVGPPFLARMVLRIALRRVRALPLEVAVISVVPGLKLINVRMRRGRALRFS